MFLNNTNIHARQSLFDRRTAFKTRNFRTVSDEMDSSSELKRVAHVIRYLVRSHCVAIDSKRRTSRKIHDRGEHFPSVEKSWMAVLMKEEKRKDRENG